MSSSNDNSAKSTKKAAPKRKPRAKPPVKQAPERANIHEAAFPPDAPTIQGVELLWKPADEAPGKWNGKLGTDECDDTAPGSQEAATDTVSIECAKSQRENGLGHWSGKLGTESCEQSPRTGKAEPSEPTPFHSNAPTHREAGTLTATNEASSTQDTKTSQGSGQNGRPATTKLEATTTEDAAGNVPLAGAETAESYSVATLACETRAQAANRWILEGRRWETDRFRQDLIRQHRADGMDRETARERAWEACLAAFPPPGVEPIIADGAFCDEEPPEPKMSPIGDTAASDSGVAGLGDIPLAWGELPANAQLQTEIAWVSANRLRVRDGSGVNLSRALSPAPSYSALSWLETSILFPSKFADISVKATANQDDEKEHIRREKMAIEEIRSILAEML